MEEKKKKKELLFLVIFFTLIIMVIWIMFWQFEFKNLSKSTNPQSLFNVNLQPLKENFLNITEQVKNQYQLIINQQSTTTPPLTNEQLELLKSKIEEEINKNQNITTSTNQNINQ